MRKLAVPLLPLLFVISVQAQEGETWLTQEKVWNVTAIKVLPNLEEQYLNNLKKTWVTGVEAAKKEGLVSDYKILASLTPADSGYNLLLIVEIPNLAAMDATDAWRERGKRIEKMVEQSIPEEEAEKISTTVYPEIRKILSEKLLREIKFIEKK
jgi:hypothetical protein